MSTSSSEEDNMIIIYMLKKKQRRRQRKRREERRRQMNLGTQESATEVNAEQNDGIKTENDPSEGDTADSEYNETVNRLESVLKDAQQVYEELKQCIENNSEDTDTDNNIKEENVEDETENIPENTNTEDNVYLNIYTQDDTPVLYQNGHVQYVNNVQYQPYPQYFVIKQEPDQ